MKDRNAAAAGSARQDSCVAATTSFAPHRTSVPTPIPMPGRLLVGRFDSLLKQAVIVPLAEVPVGTQIISTAMIGRVRHLNPGRFGRVMLTLVGDDGHWAFASVAPGTFDRVSGLLIEGARVVVRGLAARSAGNVPAFINCLDVRSAVAEPGTGLDVPSSGVPSSSAAVLAGVSRSGSVLMGAVR